MQLQLLGNNSENYAWHGVYQYSGIKTCQYVDPQILNNCPTYDRVILEDIGKLRKQAYQALVQKSGHEHLRAKTEAYDKVHNNC